jgi:hypothetical protein
VNCVAFDSFRPQTQPIAEGNEPVTGGRAIKYGVQPALLDTLA